MVKIVSVAGNDLYKILLPRGTPRVSGTLRIDHCYIDNFHSCSSAGDRSASLSGFETPDGRRSMA